jgi:hypothetical protein
MGNSGKNSNSSQFFFTLGKASQCDGKHVIFGEIVSGDEVLKKAEEFGTVEGNPTAPIQITDCGTFTPLQTPGAGFWYDKPDAECWNGISPTFMVRPRVAVVSPEAAKKKFREAIDGVCSVVLSLGIDATSVDGNKEETPAWKLLFESLATFTADVVVIAPACKELKLKMGKQLPESWNNSGFTFDEVVLISKPLEAVSSIHSESWLSKHRDQWQLDGRY